MLRRALGRARLFAAVAAACVTVPAHRAEANGRFPDAQHVWVGPGRSNRSIALRTTFGFAISHDGGQTFHWVCEAALGYSGGVFDPPFVIDAQDRMPIALFDGLGALSADGCSFERDPLFESQFMADLDANADGTNVVAVSSSGDPSRLNRVFRSRNGASFEALGPGLAGVLFTTLEMARSNEQRVYLTALIPASPSRVAFYRSDDGGATLIEVPFSPASELRSIYVAGIDPTDPDVVFVRGRLRDVVDAGSTTTLPTVLLRSEDGGTTWREVARTQSSMNGFAISDDGRTVWYGSDLVSEGLFRSTDGGFTFERIGSQQVKCLRQHEGVLYLCANFVVDGFALGQSTDRGDTFSPLLRFQDLQPPFACEPDASTNVCNASWPAVHDMFGTSMDAGIGDGGAGDSSTTTSSCGCAVPGRPASHRRGIALLALYALFLARRSRRDGRAS